MKVSIFCPIHRYGGADILFEGLEHQTFPKNEYELILNDKLYKFRRDVVESWTSKNKINTYHFEPKKKTQYHVHSSILNECLNQSQGECCIVIGDYTYLEPTFIERHYLHHLNGWCCSSPQRIFGLPKLKSNLQRPYSVFAERFNPEIFKLLPEFIMDPKLQIPSVQIDHRFCYNRGESFPREKALEIGGWNEFYDGQVGPSNKEFYLRLIHESGCKIANDPCNIVKRIMSYPIPPFTKFECSEMDDTRNMTKYKENCKKYGVNE